MAEQRGRAIQAGDLDTEIVIQQRAETQDATYGTAVEVEWVALDQDPAWANVWDMLPNGGDLAAEGIDVARRPTRIRMRYRDDVAIGMRALFNGRMTEIVTMPAMLGRRQWIQFMVEEFTTSGQQP